MRYIVKKVKDGYEFTHIWEQEGLDGKMVEVIKGRNIIKKENLEKALKETIEDRDNQFKIVEDNIAEMTKMLEAINNLGK